MIKIRSKAGSLHYIEEKDLKHYPEAEVINAAAESRGISKPVHEEVHVKSGGKPVVSGRKAEVRSSD